MRSLIVLALVAVAAFALPQSQASLDCLMCEMGVKTVVPMLDQDTKDIENAVNKECHNLLKDIPFATKKCQKFVDEDLNKIIKELESGTAPADVCKKIGMC
ncbi:surfactant protein B [Necator americanus]|uniref:Surfactant protein B n=1 Tax=Necator americanus TaxID=51031 RepID=W2TLT3_NECAM|nr:surfactant protein B [Necator americanus]ETN83070.1 surfactant protein B [Necator americanus]